MGKKKGKDSKSKYLHETPEAKKKREAKEQADQALKELKKGGKEAKRHAVVNEDDPP